MTYRSLPSPLAIIYSYGLQVTAEPAGRWLRQLRAADDSDTEADPLDLAAGNTRLLSNLLITRVILGSCPTY